MSETVHTSYYDSNVAKAIKTMDDHNVGSVVVIDNTSPRGMFTERDLLSKVLFHKRTPEATLLMEVMSTPFVTIDPEATLQQAAKTMLAKKNRLLIFEGGDLIGIVTATDIVKGIREDIGTLDIRKVITKNVTTVELYATIDYVIGSMSENRIGSVITTKNGSPHGIFTERDLIKKVLVPGVKLGTKVEDVATSPLVTAEIGIDGKEAANVMRAKHVKRLPLLEGEKLVGIITARDLVEALAIEAMPAGVIASRLGTF